MNQQTASAPTRHHSLPTASALGALALVLAGCVNQLPVRIDTQTSAEIPRERAIAFVRDYRLPPNAEQHMSRLERFRSDKLKYACEYGAEGVTFKENGRKLAYDQLRFDAMEVAGAGLLGALTGATEGVHVRILPQGSTSTICYVTTVPAGYPAADKQRELQKLGTAFGAMGIRQK